MTTRSTTLDIAESFGINDAGLLSGDTAPRRRVAPAAVAEAAKLLGRAWNGDRRATLAVNEALSTSDLFKSATGEVLDIELLAQYQTAQPQWPTIARRTTLRNFKPKQLRELIGNGAALRRVPEHTNYPEAPTTAAERLISIGKFGEQFGYTWEASLNDEIGELQQVPNGWAQQARHTEEVNVLGLLANLTTGAPNTTFFSVGNDNLGTGLLTAAALEAAITKVSTKRDKDGLLLSPGPLQLVVGPALQFTAQRLLNAAELERTVGGILLREQNPFRGAITLNVLAGLPGTAWFVLPVPTAPRPAFYSGFLVGYEAPDIRYKNDQGARVGGGAIPSNEGSFDDDTIYFRVRHVHGAAHGDPKFTYASDGVAV